MTTTLFGMEQTMRFKLVTKAVVGHDVEEESTVRPPLFFTGVFQPMAPRELLVKPEGERKWKWWTLFSDLKLEVDTVIEDGNRVQYRIMSSTDWSQAGYYQYEVLEGPGV